MSIRLDPQVVDAFTAKDEGWQSRINETLRKAVGL
ncbi:MULTISPECIES: BrnA antitoxin family protein [Rhizobium]